MPGPRGSSERQGSERSRVVSRIPNVFHFVFGLRPQTEPFHLMHYLCLASCIAVNRPDRVYFHCQHQPWGPFWDIVRPALTIVPLKPDPFITAFRYADPAMDRHRYAHLADVARLEILAAHGGIYADMDTLFVAPLPAALFERTFVMGREPVDFGQPEVMAAGGSLCNAWLAGEPGSPFAREWLARVRESFDGSWNRHSAILPFSLSREHPEWLHIEPQRSFFPFGWDRAGLNDIFTRNVRQLGGIHSIHLWSHCWWDAEARNFTTFHAGRLTPAYVRRARTTYARLARRFLSAGLGEQDLAAWTRERRKALWENSAWRVVDLPARVRRRVGR